MNLFFILFKDYTEIMVELYGSILNDSTSVLEQCGFKTVRILNSIIYLMNILSILYIII